METQGEGVGRTEGQGSAELRVRWQVYAGVFLVALATLMYEILLTRIFSVTMWYHFAFAAISVAMFGMSAGAILVYLLPRFFVFDRIHLHLGLASLGVALSMPLGLLTHLSIPFVIERSVTGIYSLGFTYAAVAVPFFFSGVCITLVLTKFTRNVGALYGADLAGAGLGCVFVLFVLEAARDAPSAVLFAALIAGLGAACFFAAAGSPRWARRLVAVTCAILAVTGAGNSILAGQGRSLLPLLYIKGHRAFPTIFETWNSFSRIAVHGDPDLRRRPTGWGMSAALPSGVKVRELGLDIDATAATPMTAFDGDLSKVAFLKYDVTNLVHYLRRGASVLVVGPGGGRDVLSALVFGQRAVTAVELNGDILDTVNKRFGDFTGHLDRDPRVRFVNDEARSYIARQSATFDIIQISLIDTWAATAAGAFALSEAALYTVEAWTSFLDHLSPNGILTVSRWYFNERPGEVYRLTALAAAALRSVGVEKPRDHIAIVRMVSRTKLGLAPDGVGTILVSRAPFTAPETATLNREAKRLRFDVVLSPRFALDDTFAALAVGEDLDGIAARFPIDISAPRDDRPFFFHMLRFKDIWKPQRWQQGGMSFNMRAVVILGALLLVVTVLTVLCIFGPLLVTSASVVGRDSLPFMIFFGGIGLGFMFIELSQMQRLILFLGHPTYALSVVLFALLVSSGLGSLSTQRAGSGNFTRAMLVRFACLLGGLVVTGAVTVPVLTAFSASTTAWRIGVAVLLLFPMGFLMGMPFPLGMRLASARFPQLTAWLWGINGATSVLASVLSVAVALQAGIAASFWTGVVCYLVAIAAIVWAGYRGGRFSLTRFASPAYSSS